MGGTCCSKDKSDKNNEIKPIGQFVKNNENIDNDKTISESLSI